MIPGDLHRFDENASRSVGDALQRYVWILAPAVRIAAPKAPNSLRSIWRARSSISAALPNANT